MTWACDNCRKLVTHRSVKEASCLLCGAEPLLIRTKGPLFKVTAPDNGFRLCLWRLGARGLWDLVVSVKPTSNGADAILAVILAKEEETDQ